MYLLQSQPASRSHCPWSSPPSFGVHRWVWRTPYVVGPGVRGSIYLQLYHEYLSPTSLDIPVVFVATLKDEDRLTGETKAGNKPPGNIPTAVATLGKVEVPERNLGALVHHVRLIIRM